MFFASFDKNGTIVVVMVTGRVVGNSSLIDSGRVARKPSRIDGKRGYHFLQDGRVEDWRGVPKV